MSVIGATGCGIPFFPGTPPQLEVTLIDNPGGTQAFGNGTVLDQVVLTGNTTTGPNFFNWTRPSFSLDANQSTDGNVALRFDLLPGAGYMAMDNFIITASTQPMPPPVPTLSQWGLILLALIALSLGAIALKKRAMNLDFRTNPE